MKILYGITKSNFGGAQRYVYELAREAVRQGHDVAVLCGGNGVLVQKLKAENIKVITLRNLQRDISLVKEIKSFVEIVKVLNKEKPYIFHINSSKMGAMGTLAGRIMRVKKIIFTAHGWAFNEPRSVWQKFLIKFFSWMTILFTHKTICVSERAKKYVSGWPFIQNKLVLIRNGLVEFELLPRKEAREKLVPNISSDTLLVTSTSELHKIKGLDVLLTAWSKFVKMRDAKLVLISDGEERSNLENIASNIGISDSIIFKGYIDNARTYLSGPDIFVMPSRSEALPYGPLEAGFAGLPVIATSVGGIPEIIESGINGILVPPADAEIIFSSLVLLSEDEALRKRLGANLKASIQENFTFEKMVRETFQLYK
jgi:glycosyltransferase involved in cell wall biosynthesis